MSSDGSSHQHLPNESGPEGTKSGSLDLENLEDTPDAFSLDNEMTTKVSSDRAFRTGRSVSSQTEDTYCPRAAPATSGSQCVYTQTEEEEDEDVSVESPPASSPAWMPESGNQVLFSGSFPIPADPARLAERIRRNRTQLSAAFDDTEYEPYGLPEVVMKGTHTIVVVLSCVCVSPASSIPTLSLNSNGNTRVCLQSQHLL